MSQCRKCKAEAAPGKRQCLRHLAEGRAANKRHADRVRAKALAAVSGYDPDIVIGLVAAQLCLMCHEPTDRGQPFCDDHKEAMTPDVSADA